MENVHVGLIYGGLSPEHEVSINSARNVFAALDPARYRVTPIWIDREGRWHIDASPSRLMEGNDDAAEDRTALFSPADAESPILGRSDGATALEPLALDVAFPMLHGKNGEDGRVQGLLETLGIPYVGPGVLSSAACMDKEITKRVLRDAGLPVVPFRLFRRGDRPTFEDVASALGRTLFVKPANTGSSVGISKVADAAAFNAALADAFAYDHKVLVEAAVTGREIECAVIGNEEPRASIPGEIVCTAEFYTYDAKYLDADAARMEVPADLPDDVAERVRALAADAYLAMGCEGMTRVDFFVTADGAVLVNELNTIPGFTERSMFPVMWAHTGMPIGELVDTLIALALDRHARDARLKTTR
ncbi:MAG TPA: D-alanine--D-alanine ligase family protein [Rubricoccaceae bacterium]|nr:D-alanine--D-alanine ligase family protein [Rubricoccaceae bacterium]